MLEPHGNRKVQDLQLYLTPQEAEKMRQELEALLRDPEANEHFHLYPDRGEAQLSCSIVTKSKLASGGYTPEERALLGG
jgi:hypothetical protein